MRPGDLVVRIDGSERRLGRVKARNYRDGCWYVTHDGQHAESVPDDALREIHDGKYQEDRHVDGMTWLNMGSSSICQEM